MAPCGGLSVPSLAVPRRFSSALRCELSPFRSPRSYVASAQVSIRPLHTQNGDIHDDRVRAAVWVDGDGREGKQGKLHSWWGAFPMTRVLLSLTVAFAVLLPRSAQAQRADSVAVVAVAQALIRAISTKDTALARTTMLPGAIFASVTDPEHPGSAARIKTDAAFYSSLPGVTEVLLERIWSPSVRFIGTSLAEVTAPYDFHIDGKFSHCGTDVFTLVRSAGAWRIASTSYTVQQSGCAPSPLGPPKP